MAKPTVLLVDDEERILRSLSMLLRHTFTVITTHDPHDAFYLLRQYSVDIIVSDQRMPSMLGTTLLTQVKYHFPNVVRVLLTGYADADSALAALNSGEIYRYVTKPWDNEAFRATLLEAAQAAQTLKQTQALVAKPSADSVLQHAVKPVLPCNCLVLDHERATAEVIAEVMGAENRVFWCQYSASALRVLAKENIAILVTELTVGDEEMSALLISLKALRPHLITIVLTQFKDTKKIIELINQARVFRCLPKPLPKGLMVRSLEAATQKYRSLEMHTSLQHPLEKMDMQPTEQTLLKERLAQVLAKLRENNVV